MPFQREKVPPKGVVPPDMGEETPLPKVVYYDLRNTFQAIISFVKKFGLIIIIILAIYLIYQQTIFHTESSYLYHYENMLTGQVEVYDSPGTHFKIPFASRVTRYNKVWTVSFGGRFTGQQILEKGPIELRFADSYIAQVPVTFRYRLPANKEYIKQIHRDFANQYNLIDSLLIQISENVMVSTATQYTGEEFFLGGLNPFKMQLFDQLQSGIYETRRKAVSSQRDLARLSQETSSTQKTATVKIWKTEPVKDKNGNILRIDNLLEDYGITVTQVTLRKPIPGPELKKLLDDNKRLDRIANEKANELALIKEEQRIQLANIEKDENTLTAHIEKEKKTQLAKKEKELALFQEDKKLLLEKKAEALELALEDQKIQLAKKQEVLAIELATVKARKEEELVVALENQKIQLANVDTQTKEKLAKKQEELALVEENQKIKLAQIEKEKKEKLAKKTEEFALVEEEKKIQLAKVEKEEKIQLAEKAKELAIIQEQQKVQLANVEKEQKVQLARVDKTQKIQLAQVEKEKQTQLAHKAKELTLVQEEQKTQVAEKLKELAIVEAEKKIQVAKKEEELAIAQANQEIQKANLEATQFEAQVIQEKGLAEAKVLKAMYEARIPEIYRVEVQKEMAEIIYPNLKGVNVTMPRNIVTLGNQDNPVQTNLDVLSSFATLGVMESLEKKVLEDQTRELGIINKE